MEQPKTYKDAFDELQVIVKKMEDAEISVDELSTIIKRASLLITICKDKLTKTEEEVAQLIEKL
jgi:exodeoxyribonuclease VII small subunit